MLLAAMATKRRRILTIEITNEDFEGAPPLDRGRIDLTLMRWNSALPSLSPLENGVGTPLLFLTAEGPFAAAEVRKLGRLLRDAMNNQGHAIIYLSEDYAEGTERILRVEITSHLVEVETGPED